MNDDSVKCYLCTETGYISHFLFSIKHSHNLCEEHSSKVLASTRYILFKSGSSDICPICEMYEIQSMRDTGKWRPVGHE